MADLSIFKLDSETITIKDTTARQTADNATTLATTASGNATTALNKINELESEISALKSGLINRASASVSIPSGTDAGMYDCGVLATLFSVTGLDQSNLITIFGYIKSGNTLALNNEVPILIYNNHLYVKLVETAGTLAIELGFVIQYKK